MKPNRVLTLGVSTLVLAAFMFVACSTAEAQQGPTADLFVDWGAVHDPEYQACSDLDITPGVTTVLDLMNVAASNCDPPIQFTYTGSGPTAFLTSIGGVYNNENGREYYWIYLVNGHSPGVGFGAYTLSNGDSVAWDYKHSSSGLSQATQSGE